MRTLRRRLPCGTRFVPPVDRWACQLEHSGSPSPCSPSPGRSRPSRPSTRTPSTRRRRTSSTPSCERTGNHILCTLASDDPDIVDEPSGIVCGSTELLFSQQRSVVGKRFYDADGGTWSSATSETFDGTFTNPDTGKVATWTQHDTVKHDLSMPGDVTSGTTHISGLFARVTGPNGGTILIDAGTFLVVEGTGETLHAERPHPFDDYFAPVTRRARADLRRPRLTAATLDAGSGCAGPGACAQSAPQPSHRANCSNGTQPRLRLGDRTSGSGRPTGMTPIGTNSSGMPR